MDNTETELLKESLNFQRRFNAIVEQIHDGEEFSDILPNVEQEILALLGAERVTVYQRGRNDREIVSKYKSGDDLHEIRIPLTTSSIAGFVALSQQALCITDVYDDGELQRIHSGLRFSKHFDEKSGFRTRAVVAVPIKYREVLLGVLQILNKIGGGAFSAQDIETANKLALVIGQKFRYELRGTRGPYDYLVQSRRIKPEYLQELETRALKESTATAALLIGEAGITRAELGTSLERYYQVPYQAYDPGIEIPRHLINNINAEYLRAQRWVPIRAEGEEVVILIDDPADAQRIMEIQRAIPSKHYSFRVGLPEDIDRFLGQSSELAGEGVDLHDLLGKLNDEIEEAAHNEIIEEVNENEATVIQLVNRLITAATEARASDIHIEPGKSRAHATVRFRVDGICQSSLSIPATHIQAVVSRIKIMSSLDISERRKPQDGKCCVRYRGRPLELRVATLPTVNGESVVLRILASSEPLPLDKLNLSQRNLDEICKLIANPHGIFLVVGPTGSGKTTTLHALVGHINTTEKKIWTAEDPVELTQPGLQQVQVQPKIGLTFDTLLRSFLRADPDVIMIGEMRDRETAHSGVEASLTGHLVFSTLHTNSAPETVTRLLDLNLEPVSFADALLGVLAQRLVRVLCEHCKQSYQVSEDEMNLLRHYYGTEYFDELDIRVHETTLFRAVGCENCNKSGYRGRTGIHELLVNSASLKSLIYRKVTAAEIAAHSKREGMRTLMQDGIRKLLLGHTDLEQIRRVATV